MDASEFAAVCSQTYTRCRDAADYLSGGDESRRELARLLGDCAEIVDLAGRVVLRGSPFADALRTLAARACITCLEAASRLGDERLRDCIDSAQRCAVLAERPNER